MLDIGLGSVDDHVISGFTDLARHCCKQLRVILKLDLKQEWQILVGREIRHIR
jgi:hypothetical protein